MHARPPRPRLSFVWLGSAFHTFPERRSCSSLDSANPTVKSDAFKFGSKRSLDQNFFASVHLASFACPGPWHGVGGEPPLRAREVHALNHKAKTHFL